MPIFFCHRDTEITENYACNAENFCMEQGAWGVVYYKCGCRNLRLHITAPCSMPHAIKLYTALSMSEN